MSDIKQSKSIETRCIYCGKAQPQDIVIEIDEDGTIHYPTITHVEGKLVLKQDGGRK